MFAVYRGTKVDWLGDITTNLFQDIVETLVSSREGNFKNAFRLFAVDKLISEVVVQSAGRPFDASSADFGATLLEPDLLESYLFSHPVIVPTTIRINAQQIRL